MCGLVMRPDPPAFPAGPAARTRPPTLAPTRTPRGCSRTRPGLRIVRRRIRPALSCRASIRASLPRIGRIGGEDAHASHATASSAVASASASSGTPPARVATIPSAVRMASLPSPHNHPSPPRGAPPFRAPALGAPGTRTPARVRAKDPPAQARKRVYGRSFGTQILGPKGTRGSMADPLGRGYGSKGYPWVHGRPFGAGVWV
jgi:hypothetical protein